MELPVLALSFGMWDRKAKGERNETKGWYERNGMKEALLRGLPRLGLTMNGMERKMAARSVALECNGEKRKLPAAGIGRQTIHALHLRRVAGLFVVFFLATMLIRAKMMANRAGGACAAIVHSVILWQSSRFSGVRLGDFLL